MSDDLRDILGYLSNMAYDDADHTPDDLEGLERVVRQKIADAEGPGPSPEARWEAHAKKVGYLTCALCDHRNPAWIHYLEDWPIHCGRPMDFVKGEG